jgi:hypothetical protein
MPSWIVLVIGAAVVLLVIIVADLIDECPLQGDWW